MSDLVLLLINFVSFEILRIPVFGFYGIKMMNLFPVDRSQQSGTGPSAKGTGPKKVIFLGPVPEKLKKIFLCCFEYFRSF